MEFAVIQTGGKQYNVKKGDIIAIEKLAKPSEVGDTIVFDKVLFWDNEKDTYIGTPYLANAKVTATVTEVGRLPTVNVVKYKQKSRYWKKNGHRQHFLKVKIESIDAGNSL